MAKNWMVIVALAACVAFASLCGCSASQNAGQADDAQAQDVQYVLYLGTNDKDTNKPVFSPDEAKEKAKDMLIERFGGYTIQEAEGGWIGDDGKKYQEYTLVIYLSDTNIEDVHAISDDFIKEFHQSSVLIQQNQTTTEFYAGQE